MISSAVWIQYTNATDRQTDTGRQQRPCLRIASRVINIISPKTKTEVTCLCFVTLWQMHSICRSLPRPAVLRALVVSIKRDYCSSVLAGAPAVVLSRLQSVPVMWSETVGLRTRPVRDQKNRSCSWPWSCRSGVVL